MRIGSGVRVGAVLDEFRHTETKLALAAASLTHLLEVVRIAKDTSQPAVFLLPVAAHLLVKMSEHGTKIDKLLQQIRVEINSPIIRVEDQENKEEEALKDASRPHENSLSDSVTATDGQQLSPIGKLPVVAIRNLAALLTLLQEQFYGETKGLNSLSDALHVFIRKKYKQPAAVLEAHHHQFESIFFEVCKWLNPGDYSVARFEDVTIIVREFLDGSYQNWNPQEDFRVAEIIDRLIFCVDAFGESASQEKRRKTKSAVGKNVAVCIFRCSEAIATSDPKQSRKSFRTSKPQGAALTVTRAVTNHRSASPFHEAVDTAVVIDYLEFIKEPVDLQLIGKGVESGPYGSKAAFKVGRPGKDVREFYDVQRINYQLLHGCSGPARIHTMLPNGSLVMRDK